MDRNEIFKNIEEHLLNDEKPSIYLNDIKDNGLLNEYPFELIKKLEKVDQSPKHHPEGNVWIHTMMVVDEGAKIRSRVDDKKAFMWALLLHDLGKFKTTKIRKGRLTSYDHDKVGEKETEEFLKCFDLSDKFIEKVTKLVRYHMHLLFVSKNMPYGNIEGMKKEADLETLSFVFEADRLGRGGVENKEEKEIKEEVERFREKYIDK